MTVVMVMLMTGGVGSCAVPTVVMVTIMTGGVCGGAVPAVVVDDGKDNCTVVV